MTFETKGLHLDDEETQFWSTKVSEYSPTGYQSTIRESDGLCYYRASTEVRAIRSDLEKMIMKMEYSGIGTASWDQTGKNYHILVKESDSPNGTNVADKLYLSSTDYSPVYFVPVRGDILTFKGGFKPANFTKTDFEINCKAGHGFLSE